MQQNIQKKRSGFTLTEMAVVLGIIGILTGAIWVAVQSVSNASKATQAAEDIASIANNIRSTYIGANSFSGAANLDQTTTFINVGNIFPPDIMVPGTPVTLKNTWGGGVIVQTSVGNNRTFRIRYLKTPPDACFRIANQLVNVGTQDAPLNLITNSGGGNQAVDHSGTTIGVSTANIQAACDKNKGSASASTEFDFSIH